MADKRPWSVTAGCAVSVALFAWDVVSAVSDEEMVEISPFLAPSLLAIGFIPLVFTVAAFLRRNWGRIVLSAINALGVLSVPFLMQLGPGMAEPMSETLLYAIAEIAIVVLLFVPASSSWYRRPFAAELVRP